MKKLLPALLLILSFAACRKDAHQPAKSNDTTATPVSDTLSVLKISPASGASGITVTISGTHFGADAGSLTVKFNGATATIQSVTDTAIKAVVPVTTTGNITVTAGAKTVKGPVFTVTQTPPYTPYTSGDVTLRTQGAVDSFATANKGRQLQITGSLNIGVPNFYDDQTNDISSLSALPVITSVTGQLFMNKISVTDASFLSKLTAAGGIYMTGSSFSALDLDQLSAFSGSLTLTAMHQLAQVHIGLATTIKSVAITDCPLLSDLSFLSGVTSASGLMLSGTGATSIRMDQLVSLSDYGLFVTNNGKLTAISFKALTTISATASTGFTQPGPLTITNCPQLDVLHFDALKTVAGKLTLSQTAIKDMTGFSALVSAGAILVNNNGALVSMHGLEKLTTLSLPAINNTGINPGYAIANRVNGMVLSTNAKLASLDGLENITSIPVAYISGNPLLNDFCPFKPSANALSKAAGYSFMYTNSSDQFVTVQVAALTLINNGAYAATADAMTAIAACK